MAGDGAGLLGLVAYDDDDDMVEEEATETQPNNDQQQVVRKSTSFRSYYKLLWART